MTQPSEQLAGDRLESAAGLVSADTSAPLGQRLGVDSTENLSAKKLSRSANRPIGHGLGPPKENDHAGCCLCLVSVSFDFVIESTRSWESRREKSVKSSFI